MSLALNQPSIVSSEVFPPGYTVYHKDRPDGYGEVFLACRSILSTSEIQLIDSTSEIVAYQIQLADQSDYCLFYLSSHVYLDTPIR